MNKTTKYIILGGILLFLAGTHLGVWLVVDDLPLAILLVLVLAACGSSNLQLSLRSTDDAEAWKKQAERWEAKYEQMKAAFDLMAEVNGKNEATIHSLMNVR